MKTLQTSRLIFVFALLIGLYISIMSYMYVLQIQKHHYFTELAHQQYSSTVTISPERSLIYDRNSKPLVFNEPCWSMFIVPKLIKKDSPTLAFLADYFPESYERYRAQPHSSYMFIKRNISTLEKKDIELYGLSDLHFIKESRRFCPHQSTTPIVGITDIDNNGISGIELLYNTELRGTPIIMHVERDARSGNYYFQKSLTHSGKQGNRIQLTIDATLQFVAYNCLEKAISKLEAQEGMVLIMEPHTGEILTAAQYPCYDPQDRQKSSLEFSKLKIVTDSYELGSVMKVFTAMAALEEKLVVSDELIDCENTKSTFINGMPVNTWKAQGEIPFCQVVQSSNNIGIAKVAHRVGKKLYTHLQKLGFARKTNLQWPGEQSGYITPPKKWSKQSLISLSFGYEITATLLQLGQAFCLIANDGYAVKPRIIKEPNRKNTGEKVYSRETIQIINDILEKTVKEGTARKAALAGFKVKAKTGSANLLTNGIYDPTKTIYTVAGIIERDNNYKRVMVIFVKGQGKRNLYAAQVSAPLFEEIAEHLIIHDRAFFDS